MDYAFTSLYERIRQKCQREGWYGGNLDRRHARLYHPQRQGFAYPPASEEQLRATEAALGFPLPPILCALYNEVANGGFGPGGGMQGALNGYGTSIDEQASTIVVDYNWHKQVGYTTFGRCGPARLVDLADYAGHQYRGKVGEHLLLPNYVWPEQMLPLEDLGCCMQACLDCKTGYMFCIAPSSNDESYEIGSIVPSLEDYLERWLGDEAVL